MSTPGQTRVGVIGTGAMGSRFARRLSDAGFQVVVWNRTRRKAEALEAYGIRVASTPKELGASVDVLLVMVWDSDALRGVAHGPDGFLDSIRAGHVVTDFSTVEPEVSSEVASLVADRGGVMIDSPVSGSLDAAQAGTVVIMVGGPAEAVRTVEPIFDVLGRLVLHVDEKNGAGLALKLAINLQVAIQEVGFGEGLALAETFGISRSRAVEVMMQSVIASPMLNYRVPFIAVPPEEVWASASQLRKDVGYAVERSSGSVAAGVIARGLLDRVIADGRGDLEAVELIVEAARPQRHEGEAR